MTEQMLREFHSWICKPLSNQKRLIDKMDVSQLAIAENTWMDAWQAATLKANQWMPIADAPQNLAVDLWCKSTRNSDYGRRVISACLVGDTWYGSNLPNPKFYEYASHFMPLPLPPTGTGGNV